jgi:hypothetical protein
MSLEEILGKFVSGRMMVKEARYVDDTLNGPLPVYEPQLVALKATSSREALPSNVTPVSKGRPGASHMCARIYFHTYVDVTSVIYQKNNA